MYKRATISEIDHNCVAYTRWNGIFEVWEDLQFYAPVNGGYVRYSQASTIAVSTCVNQICERLGSRGPTLMWMGKTPLVNLIREQHKLWKYDNTRWEQT